MITLYTGSVGSGKSFHGVEIGWEWIKKRRRRVIANFPLIFKKKESKLEERWIFEDEITVEWLMAKSIENGWYGKESQCCVIIDEAGIIFNSRDWQTKGGERMKWIKFLSQSRKFGYDFIFICQADRMIDKQIRGLVEFEVKHLKANNSFFMSFLSIFRFTLFLYVYRWYQTRLKSNLRFSYYKPWIGKRYDTMRTFNLDELIDYLEKLYEGKIIPALVATFIDAQRADLDMRLAEKIRAQQDADLAQEAQGPREGPSREGTGGLSSRSKTRLFGRLRTSDKPIDPAMQTVVEEDNQNDKDIAQ